MSSTPRTDALIGEPADVLFAHACQLERELTTEQGRSMMAGAQLSALRLQLKDAEERAARWAKIADQRAIEVADLKHALAKHQSGIHD